MPEKAKTSPPLSFHDRGEARNQHYYITTAIAYLNGAPHLGHAYEFITADICSRYHSLAGRKTLFSTGADEYGQKVANTAAKEGVEPQELCDRLVLKFQELNKVMDLSTHEYARTTAKSHQKFVQWLWRRNMDAGEIYLGTYQGWYNVREENFVTERDAAATNYIDVQSNKPYEKRNEECYFFRMSKYHDRIYDLIKNTDFVQPEARRNELLYRLESAPLEDLCVSRRGLKWGVPVPDDPDHVVYVWFDALSNYMSILNYPDGSKSEFWPANVHIVGKDITWFHCVIWPSILMAAKLPLPLKVFGHGFVNAADGNKMSKSIGNVMDPFKCIELTSSDSFRWYLVREGRYGSDLKFSMAALIDMHNADLVATIGNLVQRVTALCVKNNAGKVPDVVDNDGEVSSIVNFPEVYVRAEVAMDQYALEDLAQIGLDICRNTNKYLTDKAPWTIKDNNTAKLVIIRVVLEAVYVAAHFLQPIIPASCERIFQRLGQPQMSLCDLSEDGWNLKPSCVVSTAGDVLFTPLKVPENSVPDLSTKTSNGRK